MENKVPASKYGSINNGAGPEKDVVNGKPLSHPLNPPLFPGVLYLTAFVIIYSGTCDP